MPGGRERAREGDNGDEATYHGICLSPEAGRAAVPAIDNPRASEGTVLVKPGGGPGDSRMKTVLKIFDMGRKILHDLKHLRGGLDIINNDIHPRRGRSLG